MVPSELDLLKAFPPTQKKKAVDVHKKGSDGSGYITGKVFSRSVADDGGCNFVMTVEMGYRVHISISASITSPSPLPIAVGSSVSVGLKGAVPESLPKEEVKPLFLPVKFVWKEGIVIHVKNAKTQEEAFLNTWNSGMLPQLPLIIYGPQLLSSPLSLPEHFRSFASCGRAAAWPS